jgi:glucans biosynthesis protein
MIRMVWPSHGQWRAHLAPAGKPFETAHQHLPRRSLEAFGLLQRDQVFDHYQDDLNFYDRRPSLWVEPQGDWGPGAALYAFPTISETVDNTAAFWLSDRPARAGERRDLAIA